MAIIIGDELTDSVVVEHFDGLVGVDSIELFRTVGACVVEDGFGAARVLTKEGGAVVDVAVNDDPSRV